MKCNISNATIILYYISRKIRLKKLLKNIRKFCLTDQLFQVKTFWSLQQMLISHVRFIDDNTDDVLQVMIYNINSNTLYFTITHLRTSQSIRIHTSKRHLSRIFKSFFWLSATHQLGKRIPDSSKEQGTEQILEGHKRIVDSKQNRRQL